MEMMLSMLLRKNSACGCPSHCGPPARARRGGGSERRCQARRAKLGEAGKQAARAKTLVKGRQNQARSLPGENCPVTPSGTKAQHRTPFLNAIIARKGQRLHKKCLMHAFRDALATTSDTYCISAEEVSTSCHIRPKASNLLTREGSPLSNCNLLKACAHKGARNRHLDPMMLPNPAPP